MLFLAAARRSAVSAAESREKGQQMKKIVKKVEAPKELKGWSIELELEVPEVLRDGKADEVDWSATLLEWGTWIGSQVACEKLEEFSGIRFMDTARRLKLGGKVSKGLTDEELKVEMKGWKFGVKRRVAAGKKSPDEISLENLRELMAGLTDEEEKFALQVSIDILERRVSKGSK